MALPDGSAQVFSEVTRFSTLDANGFCAAGSQVFVTNTLLKATFTPVMETGVDLVTVNANGDIAQHYKHGDMPKYYTMALTVASPDPILHAILTGGTVLTDNSVALGAPTGTPTAVGAITGGSLKAGSYAYKVTQYNQYGETVATTELTGTVASGVAGSVVVSGWTLAAGAVGSRVYGRTAGAEQLIATIVGSATTYTDIGAIVPSGALPSVDTTAGPGNDTGYQSPALGIVGNPNGVGIEFWGKAVLNGTQTSNLPYWRWAVPGVKNLHEEAKNFQANILENAYTGQAFENPNWGSGPFGDWQFDSSKVFQYARAGMGIRPVAGLSPILATA
jgi:hypothetical protein